MKIFEKIFKLTKNPNEEAKASGELNQTSVSTEVVPTQYQKEKERKITSSAATFRAETFKESETAKKIKGVINFNDYKKQEQEELKKKIDKINLLYDFFITAKKNGITDPFILGEIANNQDYLNRSNLTLAAEIIINKKNQEELFTITGIPKEEREALAEMASKIILMSKVKAREKLKHLG